MISNCPHCGTPIELDYNYCEKCGAKIPLIPDIPADPSTEASGTAKKKLRWGWIFTSMGLIVLSLFAALFILGIILGASVNHSIHGNAALPFLVAAIAGIFFGSFLSAYISPGITIREPAIAGAVIVILGNILTKSPGGILLGWLVPYFIALGGARLGEFIQRKM